MTGGQVSRHSLIWIDVRRRIAGTLQSLAHMRRRFGYRHMQRRPTSFFVQFFAFGDDDVVVVRWHRESGSLRPIHSFRPRPPKSRTQCLFRGRGIRVAGFRRHRGFPIAAGLGFEGWSYYNSCIIWTGYNWVNVCY